MRKHDDDVELFFLAIVIIVALLCLAMMPGTAHPAASHKANCEPEAGFDINRIAASIGSRPFRQSRAKQTKPAFVPSARARFVAPILPEPIERRSFP